MANWRPPDRQSVQQTSWSGRNCPKLVKYSQKMPNWWTGARQSAKLADWRPPDRQLGRHYSKIANLGVSKWFETKICEFASPTSKMSKMALESGKSYIVLRAIPFKKCWFSLREANSAAFPPNCIFFLRILELSMDDGSFQIQNFSTAVLRKKNPCKTFLLLHPFHNLLPPPYKYNIPTL